tara:strand:- start:89 stop:802 length:714 start_codon:yes stop_codon:yes gene_type:complete
MKNPKWLRDELLLVLHLYLQNSKSPPSKTSETVYEMCETLGKLNNKLRIGSNTEKYFRNINSVYMKMMNFRNLDNSIDGKGLSNGGKDEQIVWDLYADKLEELTNIVESIRQIIDLDISIPQSLEELDEEDSEEGRIRTGLHKYRERNPKIVRKMKQDFLNTYGRLFCQVCDFDFVEVYGSRGEGYIECHHTKFLSDYDVPNRTRSTDLVLLCSNCHRMIHRQKPWLSIDELKDLKN